MNQSTWNKRLIRAIRGMLIQHKMITAALEKLPENTTEKQAEAAIRAALMEYKNVR